MTWPLLGRQYGTNALPATVLAGLALLADTFRKEWIIPPATFAELVDTSYRHPGLFWEHKPFYGGPPYGPTISDVIEWWTGYAVVADFGHPRALRWLQERFGDAAPWRALDTLPPAHRGFRGSYYYVRDVVGVLPPRPRCAGCGAKLDANRPVPDRCTIVCRRFLASPRFSRLNQKEIRLFWEHLDLPVCSPTCHDVVARRYRQLTLDLGGQRVWLEHSRKQLLAVETALAERGQLRRGGGRPKASASPSGACGRREISVT